MITGEMPSGPQPLARLNGNWRARWPAAWRRIEGGAARPAGDFIRLLEGGATPILMKRSSLLAVSAAALVVVVLAAWYIRSSPARGEAPIEETSTAVLPIVSPSTGADAEYFADALTEELSLTAAKIRGLRVIGPESAFRFKGSRLEPREIARQLARPLPPLRQRTREWRRRSHSGSAHASSGGIEAWAQEYDRDGPGEQRQI